jgi:hypothetical protein
MMRSNMKYLKMIEFLAGELAKAEELVKNQSVINAKLEQMTIEKDHWKEEALEYRNEIEPKWWDKEKELYEELEKAKEINDKYNIEVLHEQSDLVAELEEKVKSLNDKYSKAWANDFAYHHLKKVYDEDKSYYENKIAKLQVEINHFKNNK